MIAKPAPTTLCLPIVTPLTMTALPQIYTLLILSLIIATSILRGSVVPKVENLLSPFDEVYLLGLIRKDADVQGISTANITDKKLFVFNCSYYIFLVSSDDVFVSRLTDD